MTQEAPAPRRSTSGGPVARRPRSEPAAIDRTYHPTDTDVFGPGVHRVVGWVGPVLLGLVYGCWAATNRRHGGPITGGNLLFGWITTLVFVVLFVVIRKLSSKMKREQYSLMRAAFWGAAIGFLVIQSSGSVWRAAVYGLVIFAGAFLATFYFWYVREDAVGHRLLPQ
jgi:hypothetical protein